MYNAAGGWMCGAPQMTFQPKQQNQTASRVHEKRSKNLPEQEQVDQEQEKIWFLHFKQDSEQYDKIVKAHSHAIFGYLYRVSGDYELAEDLTQETFVRALSGILRFEWRGISLRAFLFRVARNSFKSWSRSKMRKNVFPVDPRELDLESGETPEAALSREMDSSIVVSCVANLPETQREVFDLFYWSDLRTWEIAKILKIRESTVKSHLFRGKMDLMAQLKAMGLDHTSFGLISDTEEPQMFKEHDWNLIDNLGREGTCDE